MNKKNVFCDTMIWYYVADNKVTLDHEKFNYYGTAINIVDFLSSDKNESNFERKEIMKKAILAMHEHSKDVICIDPLTAGASNLLGIDISKLEHKQYQNYYSTLVDLATNRTENIKSPGVDKLIEQKSNFQVYAVDTKKQFNKLFRGKTYSDKQKDEIIVSDIANWLLENFNNLFKKSYTLEEVGDWNAVIIFIKTYKQFILDVQTRTGPEANSMLDNLQLLYIRYGGDSLVWTTENKVLNKIRSQFGETEFKNIIYQDFLGEEYSKQNQF